MAPTTKQIISIVTALSVIGVTIYSIKKYRDAKKQNEQAIDLEEARKIVKEENYDYEAIDIEGVHEDAAADAYYNPKNNVIDIDGAKLFIARDKAHYDPFVDIIERDRDKSLSEEQMSELIDDARDQASYDASFMTPGAISPDKIIIGVKPSELMASNEVQEEEEQEKAYYEGPDPQEVQDSKGYFQEDKDVIDDLRYEPNSDAAREQFINMELANLGRDNDTRDVVGMLYDHPFVPTCDEDQNLKTRLQDHRINFFGMRSKWNQEVTFGDVIMYYGKAAEYNVGNDVRYWVDYFLTCVQLNDILLISDDIEDRIKALNKHNYHNQDTQSYGLFGLSANQMTEACAVARGRIDGCVTYDIEFHQFVQGVI